MKQDITKSLKPRDIVFRNKYKAVDATPILNYAKELSKQPDSSEEKKAFHKAITGSFEKIGKELLQRALEDKVFTKKEFKSWNVSAGDLCPVLQGYYMKLIEKHKDETIIVTMPHTNLFKNRKAISKKFKFKILNPEEVNKRTEKQKNADN